MEEIWPHVCMKIRSPALAMLYNDATDFNSIFRLLSQTLFPGKSPISFKLLSIQWHLSNNFLTQITSWKSQPDCRVCWATSALPMGSAPQGESAHQTFSSDVITGFRVAKALTRFTDAAKNRAVNPPVSRPTGLKESWGCSQASMLEQRFHFPPNNTK